MFTIEFFFSLYIISFWQLKRDFTEWSYFYVWATQSMTMQRAV